MDRQCGGCRLCKQAGGDQESCSAVYSQQDFLLGRVKLDLVDGHSSERVSEFAGGFSQPPTNKTGQMVPQHGHVQGDCAMLGTARGGTLCLRGQQEGHTILLPPSAGSSQRDTCVCQCVAVQPLLCLSPVRLIAAVLQKFLNETMDLRRLAIYPLLPLLVR